MQNKTKILYELTEKELKQIVNYAYIQGAIDFNDRNMDNAFEKCWLEIKNKKHVQ